MKFVAIVGSNAEQSYNRMLLQFMQRHFKIKCEIELLEIKDVPMFNQDEDQSDCFTIRYLNNKITRADGVIIATPEHNHTITPALKSTLEWLSFKLHPLENKPVMIVGASYYDQGTSRAQVHLRKILEAPGVNAYTLPGNEFLLGKAKEAFDVNGNISNEGTVKFLESCLDNNMWRWYLSCANQNRLNQKIWTVGSRLRRPSRASIQMIQTGWKKLPNRSMPLREIHM